MAEAEPGVNTKMRDSENRFRHTHNQECEQTHRGPQSTRLCDNFRDKRAWNDISNKVHRVILEILKKTKAPESDNSTYSAPIQFLFLLILGFIHVHIFILENWHFYFRELENAVLFTKCCNTRIIPSIKTQPSSTGKHQKLKEARPGSWQPREGAWPAGELTAGFWHPKLWRINLCHSLCSQVLCLSHTCTFPLVRTQPLASANTLSEITQWLT